MILQERPPKSDSRITPILLVGLPFICGLAALLMVSFFSELTTVPVDATLTEVAGVSIAIILKVLTGITIALLIWLTVLSSMQLRKWGYWTVLQDHAIKIRSEWEMNHGNERS